MSAQLTFLRLAGAFLLNNGEIGNSGALDRKVGQSPGYSTGNLEACRTIPFMLRGVFVSATHVGAGGEATSLERGESSRGPSSEKVPGGFLLAGVENANEGSETVGLN